MTIHDHHTALKSELVARINAGEIEGAFAKLQWSKENRIFTLHVSPRSFSSAGLQTTDWLAYLGFQRNDRCQFVNNGRCYSKEVPEDFDVQAFAIAFNESFGHLQKAEKVLQ